MPQPEHLTVASGCLVLVPKEMKHTVSRQERDLLPDRPSAAPRLPGSLLRADQYLAEVEPSAVFGPAVVYVRQGSGAAVTPRDRLAEREHVGRLIDPTESLVQGTHLGVGQECNLHLGVAR